jgi:hypothetical protein
MTNVREVVEQVTEGLTTDRQKAIALHNYVRDNVKFGFDRSFDTADPDHTLNCLIGHCNPKSRLMVSLFREVGLESYQHFVALKKDIIAGIFSPGTKWILYLVKELSHSYVEVNLEGSWYKIDSYVVDPPLLKAAHHKLEQENRSVGYGTRVGSTNFWDGKSDAFSQFDPSIMVEDHGRIEDLNAYYRSSKYRHVFMGVRFNTVYKLIGGIVLPPINSHMDHMRAGYGA